MTNTEVLNGIESYSTFRIPANFITSLTDALYSPMMQGKFTFENLRDSLSTGQLYSKLWAMDKLQTQTQRSYEKVVVLGSWHGLLIKWLLMQNMVIETMAVDIETNSSVLSNLVVGSKMHQSFTLDAALIDETTQDLVINTSTEHMDAVWYTKVKKGTMCLIQGTDYQIPEHVNTHSSIAQMRSMFPMTECIYEGTLVFPMYNRFMLIGIR